MSFAASLTSLLYFNSIKVRLEPYEQRRRKQPTKDFNSIKVRLEPPTGASLTSCYQFQFHKGTIRTNPRKIKKADFDISIP